MSFFDWLYIPPILIILLFAALCAYQCLADNKRFVIISINFGCLAHLADRMKLCYDSVCDCKPNLMFHN